MVIDCVKNSNYVIQNTDSAEELRIPLERPLYIYDFNEYYQACATDQANVTDHNMDVNVWYLGRNAFSVQIKLP